MIVKQVAESDDLTPGELRSMVARGDRAALLARGEEAVALAAELAQKAHLLRKKAVLARKLEALVEGTLERQGALGRLFDEFSLRATTVSEGDKFEFPKRPLPAPDRVLAYAPKIASYTQAPAYDNRFDREPVLPLSYRYNFANADEIDCSWLAAQYRENRNYRVCPMPVVKFTNNTQQNIKRTLGNRFFVTGVLYLLPVPATNHFLSFSASKYPPRVIYTTDGTEPTKHNCVAEEAEESRLGIRVARSTRFKFRTVQPGLIDSEVNELFVDIEDRDTTELGNGMMERPTYVREDDFDDFSEGGEELFLEGQFASYNDFRTLSTPR